MQYYTMMNPNEKLITLKNRAAKLYERQQDMMREIKEYEVLYGEDKLAENIDLGYLSDECTSQLSGYSSNRSNQEFNSLRFLNDVGRGTYAHLEEGKSSTADDTEAEKSVQKAQVSGS